MYFLLKTDLILVEIDCSQCEEAKDLQKNIPVVNETDQSQLSPVLASQHLCETLCLAFFSHVGIRKTSRILTWN